MRSVKLCAASFVSSAFSLFFSPLLNLLLLYSSSYRASVPSDHFCTPIAKRCQVLVVVTGSIMRQKSRGQSGCSLNS